jgi:hypothetical protein
MEIRFQAYIWLHVDKVSDDVSGHLNPDTCHENKTCVEIR